MNPRLIKVLLVDDDEDDFILTREFFSEIKSQRYEIEWASSHDKALEIIGSREHDVYLFDYRLGAYSGLDLLKEIQSRGNRIPVILLTGQTEGDVDVEAMHAGAEDFLVKAQLSAKSLERSIRYAIERKSAEREIQKLAAFPRWNPNPVFEFSADGALTYSNDAAQTLAESLQRSSPEEILPEDVKEIVSRCLAEGGTKSNLQTTIGARTFAWSFIPIHASKVVHCYATEITERLNLEAQLRHSTKMEAVGQLAAGVAHDFNNILTVIQGHADLLLHKINTDPQSEKPLKQICLASERAGALIRQLLMFSRKQVMQHRYLDLDEVIANLMQMLQRFLGEHIELEINNGKDLPTIHGDTGMIEQVLMNLSVNARDAMPKGGKLIIRTESVQLHDTAILRNRNSAARSGVFVCLSVTDTGCGMDDKTKMRIFEPFFTTKEVGKGTGLGLATVYGIVQQHNGWIEVESQVGHGSTFKVFLPACGKPPSEKPGSVTPATQGGKETLLVVEDEPALRMLVVEILQLYGYRVYQAPSGAAALGVWNDHKTSIDLLLTDMVMPDGISGRELAERLQKEKPELKVIYTSGYSPGMAGKDTALLTGFNFLPKPYPPSRLAEVVRQCLDKK